MASFSKSLESTLYRALEAANERKHEYATLEHLLLALLDDPDASAAMLDCTVDICKLRACITTYLDNDLAILIRKDATEAQPTTGFQRVIHRAVVHVQSSGRDEVTGANVLVAIFAEREGYAAYLDLRRSTVLPLHRRPVVTSVVTSSLTSRAGRRGSRDTPLNPLECQCVRLRKIECRY